MISRNTFGSLQVETITTAVKAHLPRPCPYQECIEQYQLHMTCMEAAEAYTPKHHLMFHSMHRAGRLAWQPEVLQFVVVRGQEQGA